MSLIPTSYDFNRPFRMLERDLYRPPFYNRPDDFFNWSPFDSQLVPRDFFAPDFTKPWNNSLRPWEKLRPFDELTNAMKMLEVDNTRITSDNEKFQVNVDVQHFRPEEISVKVVNGSVTIEGKHEDKQDGHGYVARQFVRRYALPEGCLPDTVESKLSSDGVLTVTAPRRLALPSIGEKIVPIQHYGPLRRSIRY